MKIDKFLQLFVVKEKKFYPLYSRQAELAENAAELLEKLMRQPDPEPRRELFEQIRGLEREGDRITAQIYRELNKSFVTPFDRDDINTLASHLDDLLDHIHDSARRIVLYKPLQISASLLEMMDLVGECTRLLSSVVNGLENIRKEPAPVEATCKRVKIIEEKADGLYESFVSTLFVRETNFPELLKQKNIVQALEDTVDAANNIADTVKGIIIKFA